MLFCYLLHLRLNVRLRLERADEISRNQMVVSEIVFPKLSSCQLLEDYRGGILNLRVTDILESGCNCSEEEATL